MSAQKGLVNSQNRLWKFVSRPDLGEARKAAVTTARYLLRSSVLRMPPEKGLYRGLNYSAYGSWVRGGLYRSNF